MKLSVVTVFAFIAIASAAPNKSAIQMKNLYKDLPVSIKNPPGTRIVGGDEVTPNSIPYQAFLEVSELFGGWYCGGSLITPNTILTAGHCSDGAFTATITLGAHRAQSPEDTQVKVQANEFTVHPEFDIDLIINDISVIRLQNSVILNEIINVVPLPSSAETNLYAGERGRVSGWGITVGTSNVLSPVLRSTSNPILTNNACAAKFNLGPVPDTQICLSGEEGHGSCNGDSGGPLTVNGVQVGIVSYGIRYCPKGFPSAFTRVTSYKKWILENSDLTE